MASERRERDRALVRCELLQSGDRDRDRTLVRYELLQSGDRYRDRTLVRCELLQSGDRDRDRTLVRCECTWRTMSDGRQQPQQFLSLSQVQAVSAAVTEAVTFALQQPEPPNAFTAENVTAGPSHSTPGRARFVVMGSI